MVRTILVTKVEHKITKEQKEVYGRYDAVKLENDGYKILDTVKRKYTMSDSDFAKYGSVTEWSRRYENLYLREFYWENIGENYIKSIR